MSTIKKLKKQKVYIILAKFFSKINKKRKDFLNRRPHRTFRLSKRSDYVKKLNLPGYFSLTKMTNVIIWKNKKIFGGLVLVYGILTALFIGMASQDIFTTLSDMLKNTSTQVAGGDFGALGQAGILMFTTVAGGATQSLNEIQQMLAGLFAIFVWLTTIWILRNKIAGVKIKLRDALYNAGAPLIPSVLLSLMLVVQVIPLALAVVGYSAAQLTGILDGGVEAMLFWIVVGLLVSLSLYWISTTLFALVVITLPGVYPIKALKTASDIVVGRRLRILYRLLWLCLVVTISWIVVFIPIILMNTWITNVWSAFRSVPLVPIVMLFMSTATLIWSASYVYMLYRKIVDDAAKQS
jgi:hypothetical protein